MAYGPDVTDMRAIRYGEIFTAITNVLERNKEMFVRIELPD
jgi:hypothetical protein